jgi:predicted dehydrogenase
VSDVLWLQVGNHFCDLRIALPGSTATHPLDLPQAFGGRVEVVQGTITFHHDLDSMGRDPAHPDVSTVHLTLEAMYERGPGFEERWVLSSGPGSPCGLAERRGPDGSILARVARVGDVALAAWGGREPGGARYVEREGWLPEPGPFPVDDVLGVNEAVPALVLGSPLPEGWVRPSVATT